MQLTIGALGLRDCQLPFDPSLLICRYWFLRDWDLHRDALQFLKTSSKASYQILQAPKKNKTATGQKQIITRLKKCLN
jgi:hypothetical protein